MITLLYDRKMRCCIRLIASVLIIAFFAYDVAWAYPDRASALAVPGLQKKDVLTSMQGSLIIDFLEKRIGTGKDLSDLGLNDVMEWQRDLEREFPDIKMKVFGKGPHARYILIRVTTSKDDIFIRYANNHYSRSFLTPPGYEEDPSTIVIYPKSGVRRSILRKTSTPQTAKTRRAMRPLKALLLALPLSVALHDATIAAESAKAPAAATSEAKKVKEIKLTKEEEARLKELIYKLEKDRDPSETKRAMDEIGKMGEKAKPAVPALIKLFDMHNYDIHVYAIMTLGAIGPAASDAVPDLLKMISAKDRDIRAIQGAAFALGEIGVANKEVISTLIRLTDDSFEGIRFAAATSFFRLGPRSKEAVPALIKLLSDKDMNTSAEAMLALGAIGPDAKDAVPELLKLLDSKDDLTMRYAAEALDKIGPGAAEAAPALIKLASDKNSNCRLDAIKILGKIGPVEGVTQALTALAQEDNYAIRSTAIETLVITKGDVKRTVPLLFKYLSSKDREERKGAAHTLGDIGPDAEAAVPMLIALFNDPEEAVRINAIQAVGKIGPKAKAAIPLLVKFLSDKDPAIRLFAAGALGGIGPEAKGAVNELVKLLTDDDPDMRAVTARAIGAMGYAAQDAVPALKALLEHKDASVRKNAAQLLGKIYPDDVSVVLPLTKALEDKDAGVVEEAARALGELGLKAGDSVPALLRLLRYQDDRRNIAAASLEKIVRGSYKTLPELVTLLSDENSDVRMQTAYVLMGMADSEPCRSALGDAGTLQAIRELWKNEKDEKVAVNFEILLDKYKAVPFWEKAIKHVGWPMSIITLASILAVIISLLWALPDFIDKIHFKRLLKAYKNKDLAVIGKYLRSNFWSSHVRLAAIKATYDLGPAAKDLLPDLMRSMNYRVSVAHCAEIRKTAVEAVMKVAPDAPEIIPKIILCLQDSSAEVRLAAIDAVGKIGPAAKEALPVLTKLSEDKDENVRKDALEAIFRVETDPKEMIPRLIKFLQDPSRNVKLTVINILPKMGPASIDAVPEMVALLWDKDKDVIRAFLNALRTISLLQPSVVGLPLTASASIRESVGNVLMRLDPERIPVSRIIKQDAPLWFLMLLQRKFPDMQCDPRLRKMLSVLNEDMKDHPNIDLIDQVPAAIERYLSSRNLKNNEEIYAEYGRITSLAGIVHCNLPLCLNSLSFAKISLSEIADLQDALPINNALTRIIRMLGEDKKNLSGSIDVTLTIRGMGKWNELYALILEIAGARERAAPNEIAGVLEVLAEYLKSGEFKRSLMTENGWKEFKNDIRAYYAAGFKVVTQQLFSYFKKHKDDKAAIKQFREDLNAEFTGLDVAWGSFYGLSDEFRKKYGLTYADEVSLLTRYNPLRDTSAEDIEGIYRNVQTRLRAKGIDNWRQEAPEGLRTLYSIGGAKVQVSYKPKSETDEIDRDRLVKRLESHMEVAAGPEFPALAKTAEELKTHPEIVRARLLSLAIPDAETRPYYAKAPVNTAALKEWLSRWHTLLSDRFKRDLKADLAARIDKWISECKDVGELEEALSGLGFTWFDISAQEKMFKTDNDIVKPVKEGDWAALEKVFMAKWLPLIPCAQVKKEKVFLAWVERALPAFLKQIEGKNKLNRRLSETEKVNIENMLLEGRKKFLADPELASVPRRKQLSKKLFDSIYGIFSDDITAIEHQLGLFTEEEMGAAEDIYVGYFDDLMHLCGEFMSSNVCTKTSRPEQVASGLSLGYHFGTIALKDSNGRLLAVSQVQILKTPLVDFPEKENKGYRVLALPGINLAPGEKPIDDRTAVMTILQAARLLAERSGLQAAVIPKQEIIHSNQGPVKNIIKDLVAVKVLKEERLAMEVVLAPPDRYPYHEVYVIGDVKGVDLAPTDVKTIVGIQKEKEKLEDRKPIPFSERLGIIMQKDDMAEEQVLGLKKEIEAAIADMPADIVEELHLRFMVDDVTLRIVPDNSLAASSVSRTPTEITVYIGTDVLYGSGKVDTITLRQVMAEGIASAIIPEYNELKKASATNENACLKIETIKLLLNRKAYLPLYHKLICGGKWNEQDYWDGKTPEQKEELARKYGKDLDTFTEGMSGIAQWNMFLSVMDDADPDFLAFNYVHILPKLDEKDTASMIKAISGAKVLDKVSLVSLRNVMKEFFFAGSVTIKIGDDSHTRTEFRNLKDEERLTRIKDALLLARNRNDFYNALRELLTITLPLSDDALQQEMLCLVNKDLFSATEKEAAVKKALREFLVRRIGNRAFTAIQEHLSAKRGSKDIPYIEMLAKEISEGDDADKYEWLKYVPSGDDYKLVLGRQEDDKGGEDSVMDAPAAEDRDWVRSLFPMKPPARDDIGRDAGRGAIANGAPLRELAEGKLPPRLAPLPESEFAELERKMGEAIHIALTLTLSRSGQLSAQDQERARQAFTKIVQLQKSLPQVLYLFNADVRSPEDYLLGFSLLSRDEFTAGLSFELINKLYSISPKRLAQYIFHECVPEKGAVTDRDDHRAVYNDIQATIFGRDEMLALKKNLRDFISEKVAKMPASAQPPQTEIAPQEDMRPTKHTENADSWKNARISAWSISNRRSECHLEEADLRSIETFLAGHGLEDDASRRAAYNLLYMVTDRPEFVKDTTVTTLKAILARNDLEHKPYDMAAFDLYYIAINNPALSQKAMQALKEILTMDDLPGLSYSGAAYELTHIAITCPALSQKALQYLEDILARDDLQGAVYLSVAYALLNLAREKPELIKKAMVTSLEALSFRNSLQGDDHWKKLSEILPKIAAKRPDLFPRVDKIELLIKNMHELFMGSRPAFAAGSKILISENLLTEEDTVALRSALENDVVEILPAEVIRNAAINGTASKDKLGCIISREEFNTLWKDSHRTNNKSAVLVLDEDMKDNRYLYLEGIVGLVHAMMNSDTEKARAYASLLFSTSIDDQVLEFLKKDNPIEFAIRAILKFKPIEPMRTGELQEYKKMVETALAAA